jgi:hypothetical protein
MTTMPTTPLAISQPDQLPAALDNLLALDLITRKQARVISLLAGQPDTITVERVGRYVHARAGSRHIHVMNNGVVRYL